jgi:hypothetical protein
LSLRRQQPNQADGAILTRWYVLRINRNRVIGQTMRVGGFAPIITTHCSPLLLARKLRSFSETGSILFFRRQVCLPGRAAVVGDLRVEFSDFLFKQGDGGGTDIFAAGVHFDRSILKTAELIDQQPS